jgi:hypothetical protein
MGFLNDLWNGVTGGTGMQGYEQQGYAIDRSAFDPDAHEGALVTNLERRANGQAPSAAENQMQIGVDKAQQNSSSMAAAQRGISPALAAKIAQQSNAQMAQQTNQQAGVMRAQEMQNADAQLAQALQSIRGGRMSREQLGVQQTQGVNQVGAQAYDARAGRAGGLMSGIGAAMMADGGEVLPTLDNTQSLKSSSDSLLQSFATALGQQMAMQMPKLAGQNEKAGFQMPGGAAGGAGGASSGGGTAMAGGAMDAGGAASAAAMVASKGAVVPGEAEVAGDSQKNDKVPALLSPGEIVVPRSIAEMSPEKIAQFVAALKAGA